MKPNDFVDFIGKTDAIGLLRVIERTLKDMDEMEFYYPQKGLLLASMEHAHLLEKDLYYLLHEVLKVAQLCGEEEE